MERGLFFVDVVGTNRSANHDGPALAFHGVPLGSSRSSHVEIGDGAVNTPNESTLKKRSTLPNWG